MSDESEIAYSDAPEKPRSRFSLTTLISCVAFLTLFLGLSQSTWNFQVSTPSLWQGKINYDVAEMGWPLRVRQRSVRIEAEGANVKAMTRLRQTGGIAENFFTGYVRINTAFALLAALLCTIATEVAVRWKQGKSAKALSVYCCIAALAMSIFSYSIFSGPRNGPVMTPNYYWAANAFQQINRAMLNYRIQTVRFASSLKQLEAVGGLTKDFAVEAADHGYQIEFAHPRPGTHSRWKYGVVLKPIAHGVTAEMTLYTVESKSLFAKDFRGPIRPEEIPRDGSSPDRKKYEKWYIVDYGG